MNNYLITGVSSFLGSSFAKSLLADKSYNVILTSRTTLQYVPEDLQGNLYLSEIDLMKEDDINKLIEIVESFFNGPFAVIHCSGYFKGQLPLEKRTLNEGQKILEGNFTTVYNLTQKLLTTMSNKGGGHIIGFSCNSVVYNYPFMSTFTAAKTALESFLKSIANEFYDRNIYANSFRLATLLTDYEKKQKPYGDHHHWLKLEEVVQYVLEFINVKNQLHNGNAIQLYHHSDSFFNKSYFERIKK